MKYKLRRRMSLGWLWLLLPWWGVSCVDSRYDLDKDIDMTINVGGEYLTFPVGSTDTTFLSKLISLEEDGMLQVDAATRVYHLTHYGWLNVKPVTVSQVTLGEIVTGLLPKEIVQPATSSEMECRADVSSAGYFEVTARGVDNALKELGALRTKVPAELKLTFNFERLGLDYRQVKAEKLTVEFPDFVEFEEGQEGLSGNRLSLDGLVLSAYGASFSRTLKVTGYRFGNAVGQGVSPDEERNMRIEGRLSMTGSVITTGTTGYGSLVLVPNIALGEMKMDYVTGVIQPEIDTDVARIKLEGLPDFLKNESTHLDITNPVIVFKVDNPLQTEVEIDGVFIPGKGEVELMGKGVFVGRGYGKQPLSLVPGENVIALSRLGQSAVKGAVNVKVEDMNDLLGVVPDFIDVILTPVVRNETYYEVELGRKYELPVSYDVDIPLSFEHDLQIVYTDSIRNLHKDLKDLNKLNLKQVNLILSVRNAIPLRLQLSPENVQLKDVYGEELTGVVKKMEEDERYVAESADGETPADSEIVLRLQAEDKAFLTKLDRICFRMTGVSGSATGVPLKDTQWLKVTNLKVSVPGGVNVDLN